MKILVMLLLIGWLLCGCGTWTPDPCEDYERITYGSGCREKATQKFVEQSKCAPCAEQATP